MNVGPSEGDDEVVSAINTTPLVDVMLVLLIIFLITIPVVTHTVPVSLPKDRNQPTQTKPENIIIAVNKDGDYFWNEKPVADIGGAAGTAEADRREGTAAGGAYPRRRERALRVRRQGGRRLAAGGHLQDRLHHRAATEQRRTPNRSRYWTRAMAMTCRRAATATNGRRRRDEHHAADRRDAGAADHADHHDPDPDPCGEARSAGGQSAAAAGAARPW